MSKEFVRSSIEEYLKFRKEYLNKEEDARLEQFKRLGGVFSYIVTSDETILEKFLKARYGKD